MNNSIRKDFTIIPNQLINDANLSRDSRFMFVYLCSKPDNWKYHNSVIERELNCSKDSRIKYMKELAESGWISIEQKRGEGGSFAENNIILNPFPKFVNGVVKKLQPEKTVAGKNGSRKITTHNNTDLFNNTNNFNNTEDIIENLPKKVLDYLNEKRNSPKGFKPTSSNLTPIKARIKEGFKLEDFMNVIDASIVKWANDEKMRTYIRPETLFGTKFNSYLVESEDVIKQAPQNTGSKNFEYTPMDTVQFKEE